MSVNSEISFFEKCSILFNQINGVRIVPIANNHNYSLNKINLCYGGDEDSSSFVIEYSTCCLELYGTEQVPSELVDALTKALPGAQYQQYNLRTHYWSGKAIDDYFLNENRN